MHPQVLEAVLSKEQRAAGLYLETDGDHLLYLRHKGSDKPLAVFLQTNVLATTIIEEAERQLRHLQFEERVAHSLCAGEGAPL